MSDRLDQALSKERQNDVSKKVTIQEIIEQERRNMHERFTEDVKTLGEQNQFKSQRLEAEIGGIKNRNERLQKDYLEKEQTVLELQHTNAELESEVSTLTEQLDIQGAKLKALEKFSREEQQKFEVLQNKCHQQEDKINHLMSDGLPQRCAEQEKQLQMLDQKL